MRRVAATSSYAVKLGRPRRAPVAAQQPQTRVPRVARLLALAWRIDALVGTGELKDLVHAAKVCGVTRPRMTQIMNLLLLAPAIQEAILDLPPVRRGRDRVTERQLRPVSGEPDWTNQTAMWRRLHREDR